MMISTSMVFIIVFLISNGGGAWVAVMPTPFSWKKETLQVHLPRLSRYAGMRLIHTPEWLETLARGDSHAAAAFPFHLNATSMMMMTEKDQNREEEEETAGQWIRIAHVCRPFRALDKARCVDMVLLINRILRVRMRLISEHPARTHVHCMTYDGQDMLASYTLEVRRGLTLEVHAEYPHACSRFMSRFTRRLIRSMERREEESPTPSFCRGEPNLILFRQIVFGFRS